MLIKELLPKYLEEMKIRNLSPVTIRVTRYSLLEAIRFLAEEKVYHLEELNRDVLEEYRHDLAFRLTAQGKPLSVRSQEKHLSCAKGFSRFLYEKDYLSSDPGKMLKSPKQPKRLPRVILDSSELKKLLAAPDMRTNQGQRDRIILEILYDTGIRASEMANLKVHDLDLKGGYGQVLGGKGAKDRVVPISKRVCSLIRDYLLMVRPHYLGSNRDEGYLVLNRYGTRMTTNAVWFTVKRCAKAAGIRKNISTHTFRHSCATHMLKNGAPVRHIQELLGHESLETTQVYTHVTINDLKAIHAKYHPGEMR